MGMTARGRKRLLALVLVAAALGAAALGAVALREHRRAGMVEAALQDGLAAYAASDYTRTMNRLGFFVSRSNGDDDTLLADVFYKMADARRRVPMENRRHVLLAAELARRAAELTPTDPAPREMLLDLYTQMGFVSESLDNAAALLALRPGHAEAMWVRIRSLSALGRRTEAIQVAEEMAEAHPQDIRPRQAAIELLVAIGRPIGEILEYAAEQAQARPDDVLARLLLARVQAISGDNVAAAATLLDAREMPITNPDALGEMVRLLDAVGAPAEADRLLARYRGSDELGPAAALIEVERRWKLGDLASARAAADVLIASAPTPSDAALGWAALSTSSEQGAAYLDALRERKSAEAQFWLGLAQARDLVLARNWTQAGAQLGLLETQAPTAHRDLVAYWLGVTQGALGEQTRAVQYLLDASRLDPNWEFARAQLVMQLLRLGRVEEAVMRARAMENPRTLEGALATAHAVTAAVERGGLGLFSVNEGVTALTELTKRDPTNGDFSSMLIRAYAAVGRLDDAGAELVRLIDNELAVDPGALRDLHASVKRYDIPGADRLITMTSMQAGSDPDLLYIRASEAARAGRIDEGKSMLREAISRADESDRMALRRAQARFLVEAGSPEAIDALRQLAADYPESAAVQNDLLESDIVWTDSTLVGATIARLRALSGEDGVSWRINEARRLLTFGGDEASASEAMLLLERLTRSEPPLTSALVLAGEAMLVLDDREAAVRFFTRAVEAEPRSSAVYPRLIALLQRTGRTVDAERRLRDYMELRELSDVERRRRAELLVTQGMWGAALPELRTLAESGEPRDMVLLAQAHLRRGDPAAASTVFDRIAASPRADAASLVAVADFFASRGETDRGLAVLERLPTDTPPTQRALLQTGFLERIGRLDDAQRTLAGAAESIDAPELWAELSRFYIRRANVEDARAAIEQGLQRHPDSTQLLSMRRLDDIAGRGQISSAEMRRIVSGLGAGQDSPALAALLEAVQWTQTNPDSYEETIQRFRAVVSEFPTFFPGWSMLAGALLSAPDADRSDEMVRVARTSMEVLPNDPRAGELAYELLRAIGRLEEAAGAAREWRDRSAGDTFQAEVALAGAELQLGRAPAALATLERWTQRILSEADDRPAQLELLALVYAANGREREAHELLWPRAQSDADWASVYLSAARILVAPPDVIDAWIERLDTVLKDPGERIVLANFRLESAIAAGGQIERVRRAADLADTVRDDPRLGATATLIKAIALEQAGDTQDAERAYRAVIQAQPNNPTALNNLAYLVLTSGGSVEEAVALAERANASSGGMGATERAMLMDTLGECLLAADRPAKAEQTFRTAIDLAPATARLHIGLGEALVAQDRISEAATAVSSAQSAGRIQDDEKLLRRLEALERRVRQQ